MQKLTDFFFKNQLFVLIVVLAAALALVVLKREVDEYKFLVLLVLFGWFSLFLTHNKSAFIWELLPTAAYLQFPWRFLGVAVFAFSLGSGAVIKIFGKYKVLTSSVVIPGAIFLNFSFFREDILYNVKDSDLVSGERRVDQMPEYKLGDYVFKNIDWIVDSKRSDTYLVGRPKEFPMDVSPLKKITFPEDRDAL